MRLPPGLLRKLSGRDENGRPNKALHPTDYMVVLVAFLITCCFVYLALVPQNWSAIDRAMAPVEAPKPPPPQQKKGETQMILFDTQKD